MIKATEAQLQLVERVYAAEKPFGTVGDETTVELVQGACQHLASGDLVELIDDDAGVRVGYVLRKHSDRLVDLLNAAAVAQKHA